MCSHLHARREWPAQSDNSVMKPGLATGVNWNRVSGMRRRRGWEREGGREGKECNLTEFPVCLQESPGNNKQRSEVVPITGNICSFAGPEKL
ncbi:hypothetical protein RRG08_052190 [Elysia crispata]|uniref:Uncharacterized protein n=1 Tax=Elysia crispata TaxID=231223 RepID=A0AAE0Z1Q5_9GAST|nr:hypothetical protein RRG08_052190 [Elysia crispata]